jgi:hypothetical protein
MSRAKTNCEKQFSYPYPELEFCRAAESYVKDEISHVGGKQTKAIFSKFKKGLASFHDKIQDKVLRINIELLTDLSKVVKEGNEEMEEAIKLLGSNCINIRSVADRKLKELKTDTKLYFTGEKGEYHVTNRLPTNYTAIAVLFTKFFYQKGAFDGVKINNNINWDEIVRNWIEHSFNPSVKFIDIRPEEEQNNKSAELSSLEFQEMLEIYFTNNTTFNSHDIRGAVEEVLNDIRAKGFDTENKYEKKLKEHDVNYIRYARDFGFVDMNLGIDFIYKVKNSWIPIQIKSSKRQETYLIDTLGCRRYIVAYIENGEWVQKNISKNDFLPVY